MTLALEVKDLSFSYPDGKPALRSVSFSIEAGECVGVIGPNGAGKSTLLLHLNGLLPEHLSEPARIMVSGQPLDREHVREIRRQVGLVFQDADDQLFCPTVFEDVAFGPQQLGLTPDEVAARVRTALESVGLIGFEDRAPHRLSGGEKRRVCIAGVLACQPSVLVLDEPTSDLDPRGRRELKQLLRDIPITRIIATHDLEMVAQLCSRVLVIDGGQIVAQGPAVKILSDEPLMIRHGLEKPHILQHMHPHPLQPPPEKF